ncbi:MAG: class I SAM-dependent methyltransferase [Solirubrobacteraceae bacterium]
MTARTVERSWGADEDHVTCAWCGASARSSRSRLAVCPRCASATTYPRPSDDELEQAYVGWYRPPSGRFPAGGDRLLALSRARLARRLDRIAPSGPVLDVGAGEGTLVRALQARGREALGLERVSGGDGVVAREVVDFDQSLGEWAGVVFWHSLEHLGEPARALDRACQLLARGGVLVIALPNLSSWQARWFGRRWFHLDLPRHLVHVPAAALRQGVKDRGLRVERVSHWRGGQLVFGWLHGFVGLLPGHPNLYDAIRRGEARSGVMSPGARAGALVAAAVLTPLALVLTVAEVAAGAGGTVYVEARKQ